MNELEIENFLISDPLTSLKFRGVVSYDELCYLCNETGIFIVNLDASTGYGTHWVCLYLESGISEYFDSLGNPPLKIESFLLSRNCDYIFNAKKIQGNNSDVCGDYCILFCYFRARGVSFEEFLSFFSDDLTLNDKMIEL